VILVRSIFSWHLPIALFDPLWLGFAALVAAAVLLRRVDRCETLCRSSKTQSKN
jgi:hypothetical protein